MEVVLTGIDIIIDDQGNPKVLEFNTDVDLGEAHIPHFKKDVILSYIQEKNLDNIIVIDKGSEDEYSLIQNRFYYDFKTYFENHNIPVERYFVALDAVDILDINLNNVDQEKTLIFRVAYDVYNEIDNTYASNKMLFREMMIEKGHEDMMPRFSGLLYDLGYYTNIPYLYTGHTGNYPDLVTKNVIEDLSTGISFYKILEGSTDQKNDIYTNNDYTEEFIPTNFSGHTGFYRVWYIIDELNNYTYLGGYLNLSPSEIPDVLDYYEGTGLIKKYQYSSFLQTMIGAGVGICGDSLVRKKDGSLVPMKDVVPGDEILSIKIEGLPDEDDGPYEYLEWYVEGDQLPTGSTPHYVTVIDVWPVKVDITIKIVTSDQITTIIGLMSQILYWSKEENRIRFMSNAELRVGDKVLTPTGDFKEVISLEYVKNKRETLYLMAVEPEDYFLTGNLLAHNATTTKSSTQP